MHRFKLASLLLFAILLISHAAQVKDPPAKKTYAEEEIQKAIQNLGDARFAIRERASKLLWEAGAAAEKALEQAERSTDEERATRAKSILEKFRWGLYPDTSEEIRKIIGKFKDGDAEQRQEALGEVFRLNPIPFSVLRKLLTKEDDEKARQEMFIRMSGQIHDAIPRVLLRNDYAAAEDLLEISIVGAPAATGSDYAVFMYLRGKLDAAIERFEKQVDKEGKLKPNAATVLVHLYRVKADWKAARKAAEVAEDRGLAEDVLWESSDWKALSELPGGPRDAVNRLGVMAACARLAGDAAKFNGIVDDLSKTEGEHDAIGEAINALLLNRKANLALEMMVENKVKLSVAFELLCAQMRHQEAFELIDKMEKKVTDSNERNLIDIRRAKMLHQLGEREAARQIFERVADAIDYNRNDHAAANQLIKAEGRAGLTDSALNHAGRLLSKAKEIGGLDGPELEKLLEPIFGEEGKFLALTWWRLMQADAPTEDHGVTLKRVHDLMTGKLDAKLTQKWLEKMERQARREAPKEENNGETVIMPDSGYAPFWAIAQAHRALKDDAKAEAYYKRSAEAVPAPQGWIRYGDYLMEKKDKKRYKEAADCYAKAVQHALTRKNLKDQNVDSAFHESLNDPTLPAYLQGRALKLAGDAKEGDRLIEVAHWLPLGSEETRGRLIDELTKRDWPEMARKETFMAVKTGWYKNYFYGNIISQAARDAAREKQFDKAANYYERCLVGCMRMGASFIEPTAYLIVPESVRVYQARDLLGKGKVKEALALAQENLETMPGNVEVAIKLVPELDKQGKKKEADELYQKVKGAYEKVLKQYPDYGYGHNSFAWLMANCKRDLDEAIKHSERAVKLEPKSSGFLDTLAETYFRKGNRERALELMKKCNEMDKNNVYYQRQLERFKSQPFDSPTPVGGDDE